MVDLLQFKRGESLKFYKKLELKEKKEIEDYLKYLSITSKSKVRLENNKRNLLTLRKFIKKPLSKTTLKDLRDFLSQLNNSNRTQASKNDLKHSIKRFLKWRFKDWSKRFDNLSDIKLHVGFNEEKINSSSLVSPQDIAEILRHTPKVKWRAFFMALYESALRPIELRNLLWKNITFDTDQGGISELNIYATKTSKSRVVYVKEATKYLKQLKEKSISDLVFPSNKDPNKPMSKEIPSYWLARISKKALGRRIYPYILRHSRATELYTNSNIPDKIASKFMGHSKSMADVYTHLSKEDVKEAMSKTIYKPKDLTPEEKGELSIKVEGLEKENEKLKKGLGHIHTFLSILKDNKVMNKKRSRILEKVMDKYAKDLGS